MDFNNDDSLIDPLDPIADEVDADAEISEDAIVEDEDSDTESVWSMNDDGELEEAL